MDCFLNNILSGAISVNDAVDWKSCNPAFCVSTLVFFAYIVISLSLI